MEWGLRKSYSKYLTTSEAQEISDIKQGVLIFGGGPKDSCEAGHSSVTGGESVP